LNGKGKIKSVSCVELELGDLAPSDPIDLTGVVTGRVKLSKSCRITGELNEEDDGEMVVSQIRGSANQDVQVMHGVFYYTDGDGNSIDTFTATKR